MQDFDSALPNPSTSMLYILNIEIKDPEIS